MTTHCTVNVHTDDDTPINARFFDSVPDDFTSLQIGDASVFLRGDNVKRLAGVLNDYISARATPGREQSVTA